MEPTKMGWVAMLVQGNSVSIGGKAFKLHTPIWINSDVAMVLKKYGRMFKVWQQPMDQPLPKMNVAEPPQREIRTADMKPTKVADLSQKESAQKFIVRPADVEKAEAIEVAGVETAPDSWPDGNVDAPAPEVGEPVEEVEEPEEDVFTSPSGKSVAVSSVKKSVKKRK